MPLISLPEFDTINLALQGADLEATLKEMFAPLRSLAGLTEPAQAWADLIARQAAGPVALDDDVGLPHVRTGGVNRIIIAAGRHVRGIGFDQKHQTVRLIFLILTPKEQPAEYLQLVASLAARLRQADVRRGLLTTTISADFSALLRK